MKEKNKLFDGTDSNKKEKKQSKKIWKWIKKHKKLLIFLVILAGVGTYVKIQIDKAKDQLALMMQQAQETDTVERRDLVSYIRTSGKVESDKHEELISTLTGYEVKSVSVEVGDIVKTGDLLVAFDTADLEKDIADANTDISNTNRQNDISIGQAQRDLNNTKESVQENNNNLIRAVVDALEDLEDAKKEQQNLEIQLVTDTEYLQMKQSALEAVRGDYLISDFDYQDKKNELSEIETKLNTAKSQLSIAQTNLAEYKLNNGDEFDAAGEVQDGASKKAQELYDKVNAAQELVYTYSVQYENASIVLNEISSKYTEASGTWQSLEQEYNNALTAWQTTNDTLVAKREEVKRFQKIYDDAVINQNAGMRNNNASIQSKEESIENQNITKNSSTRTLEDKIEDYQKNLEKAVITSPIDGIVTDVNVEEGDTYTSGIIVTVQNTDTFIVAAEIDEYDISSVKMGMKVLMKTDATRDDELEGEVTFISPTPTTVTITNASGTTSSSTGSATYRVEITIKTKDDRLRIGMTAKTNIILDELSQVLTVPYDALQTDVEGNTVITLQETDELGNITTRNVPVTVGTEGDYYVEITCDEEIEGKTVIVPESETSLSNMFMYY